jgi:hypothetical protein
MSARPHAINLQFGKSAVRYQDVIVLPIVSVISINSAACFCEISVKPIESF